MRRQPILMLLTLLLMALPAISRGATPFVLNPDGAWCWFQDERAIVYDGKLTAASMKRHGDLQVTTWDYRKGSVSTFTLRRDFGADDHNVAALLLRNDGRLMAFYTMHGREARMYWRQTTMPRQADHWDPEAGFDAGVRDKFTYANPFQLRGEANRIYLFWRGIDWNPTWSCSDDGGMSWRTGANHIYFRKGERPYVKYASNGIDTIHFAFTEAHPDTPISTSLYHCYYKRGGLYTSDGRLVRKLVDGPIHPSEATKVYDGTNSSTGEAWVWDIALDAAGRPVIAYTSRLTPMDHRYRYARWTGDHWEDHQIAYAGSRLYEREPFYSGGICLDPDRTNVVYVSSNVDIRTGSPNGSGRYEIYRGVTNDGGKTWRWQPVTRNSVKDNIRPIVPAHHPGTRFVLWLRGAYRAYTDYETEVVVDADAGVAPKAK